MFRVKGQLGMFQSALRAIAPVLRRSKIVERLQTRAILLFDKVALFRYEVFKKRYFALTNFETGIENHKAILYNKCIIHFEIMQQSYGDKK